MSMMTWSDGRIPALGSWDSMLTPHAEIRMQQRGVENEVLGCLLQYGRRQHGPGGCELHFLDDAALDAIARHEPHRLLLRMTEARNLYAVVNSDGYVITTGYRYRRMLRDISLSSMRPGRSRRPRVRRRRPVWYQFN